MLRGAPGQSLAVRAVPAALADLSKGVPDWAWNLLREMSEGAPELANLYFRTMMEEAPNMATLEAALTPEMLGKLRQIASFRDYEAKFQAEATAQAEAEAEARVEAKVEARVEAKLAEVIAGTLKNFLVARGDKPTTHAIKTISASHDADELDAWLRRASLGETSAQLFPEPQV